MKTKPTDAVRCMAYLEKHGGTLTMVPVQTTWMDGTKTPYAWSYASGTLQVCAEKTAMDAIKKHMELSKIEIKPKAKR